MKTKKYVEMVEKPLSLLAEKMSRKIFCLRLFFFFLLFPIFVARTEPPEALAREKERREVKSAKAIVMSSVDFGGVNDDGDDDDDFGEFENAKEEVRPPPIKVTPTTTSTTVQQQQKSPVLEFLSLTDADFRVAVATAFGEGVSKPTTRETTVQTTPATAKVKVTAESIGRSEEKEDDDTISKTMETTAAEARGEVHEEQLPKVGVSIAERMKMFEQQQQQQPHNENDAFAGFEDLTVSERAGQDDSLTGPPSVSLL